jgi:hypothetical protein
MPRRRLAALGSVVPASPTYTSSESESRRHNASELWSPGITSVRTPSSTPLALTSGATRSTGSPVFGSVVVVVPRASLL